MLTITELQRRAGRVPKGRQHTPTDLREMILGALEDAGGRKYLAQRAIDTPGPFLTLLGKVLPTKLSNEDGSPLSLHLLAAQIISVQLAEQASIQTHTPDTINGSVSTPANLLDAPPPTE